MATPFHQYASHPLPTDPAAARTALRESPQQLVASATATALDAMAPLARSWGLTPEQLPTVTARPTSGNELGTLELTWTGDEQRTAWPSLTGRLLIDLRPDADHRLALVTQRSPDAELATARVGRHHRRRLTNIAVQGFLRDLTHELAAPSALAGPAAGDFDRTPMFVHDLRFVDVDPGHMLAHLTNDPQRLAERATSTAIDATRDALATGRFRAPARPLVHAGRPSPGQLGALHIAWDSDEEATGWPTLALTAVVEPQQQGTRLALLSAREPRYDLNVNRVDKHARHEILQHVAGALADALTAELTTDGATDPGDATRPVHAGTTAS